MSAQDNQPTHAALQTQIASLQQRNAVLEQLLTDHGIAVPPAEELPVVEPDASDSSAHSQTADRLRLYEVLVENALDGIGVSDMNGIITYANKAFKELTGFGEKTIGSLMVDYFDPVDFEQVAQEILPALQNEGKYQGQLRYRRPDGTFFIGEISAFMVRDVRDTLIAQAGTELEHGNDDGKANTQYLEGTVTRCLGYVEAWGSRDVHLMAFAPGILFPWQQVNRYTETAGPHLLIYSC